MSIRQIFVVPCNHSSLNQHFYHIKSEVNYKQEGTTAYTVVVIQSRATNSIRNCSFSCVVLDEFIFQGIEEYDQLYTILHGMSPFII